MSLKHSDALKILFPITLEGCWEGDLILEGKQLDILQEQTDLLNSEMFPNSAYELLERWERTYGLTPGAEDSLQLRQNRILQKMRDLGRLDRAYFITVALGLGFTITIEELRPFMIGWDGVDDELMFDDADWCWRVTSTYEPGYYFRIGESAAGENLSDSYLTLLADILNELKPADTYIEFVQS